MKIPSGRDDRVLKYNQIFAKRMKARRQECSISQQKLANAIGVQQPAISSYESGLIFPQPQKLVAICLCLQTSADYLIGLSDDPMGPSSINSNFIQSVYDLDECSSYNP